MDLKQLHDLIENNTVLLVTEDTTEFISSDLETYEDDDDDYLELTITTMYDQHQFNSNTAQIMAEGPFVHIMSDGDEATEIHLKFFKALNVKELI